MTTLYGISNCDTVKKARAWLGEQGLAYQFHDFKKQGVPLDLIDGWIAQLGWESLLNRQGTTWRKLPDDAKAAVHDGASAKALMLAQPSVMKRPVVQWPAGRLTVGFKAEVWLQLLSAAHL